MKNFPEGWFTDPLKMPKSIIESLNLLTGTDRKNALPSAKFNGVPLSRKV
jgi:hypothetical protein